MSRRISLPEDCADPPIKLFGCNIQFLDSHNSEPAESDSRELDASAAAAPPPPSSSSSAATTTSMETSLEIRKEEQNGCVAGPLKPVKEEVDSFDHQQEDLKNADSKSQQRKPTELNSDNEGKVFKKPDKIVPCPRCNSMETKFCYFNNYNVNQPRHFCRSCQRYWTAGGTIRNVPVGAGRRKNKHFSSQFSQSGGISCNGSSPSSSTAHLNLLDSAGSCGSGLSPTGLTKPTGFSREGNREALQGGCDTPFCNSVTTLLTLKDQNQNRYVESCSESSREAISLSPPSGTASSAPTTRHNNGSTEELVQSGAQFGSSGSHAAVLPTLQGFPGPPQPAPYPWNIGWTGMAAYGAENGQAILLPWGFSPVAAYPSAPGATPSIPYPFIAPPYMSWNTNSWNSTASSSQLSPPSSASNSSCSSSSPSLGKHSRDGEEPVEKCIWVPKTLRMDDPDEAAKSSIWTTLGIKPDRIESFSKDGVSRAGRGKCEGDGEEKTTPKASKETDSSLQANPAALSRSQAFQETT